MEPLRCTALRMLPVSGLALLLGPFGSCATTERALVLVIDSDPPEGVATLLIESQFEGEYGKDLVATPDQKRIAMVDLPEGRQGLLIASASWVDSGGCKIGQGQISFDLPSVDKFVTERHLSIDPLPQRLCSLTVTIQSGQGTVLSTPDSSLLSCHNPARRGPWVCRRDLQAGTKISVTAVPDTRYSTYTLENGCTVRDTSCSVTLAGPVSIDARFADRVCSPDSSWCFYSPLPAGYELRAVGATGSSDMWAVGEQATILHYDGRFWTRSPVDKSVPNVTLRTVWGASSTDAWAAGDQGILLHYDGSGWRESPQSRLASLALNSLFGTSPSSVWAAGDTGKILHYDGTSWAFEDHKQGPTDLNAIWGIDDQHLFAVGKSATILERTGTSWSKRTLTGTTVALHAIWGRSASDLWAVGDNGVAAHRDGSGWVVDASVATLTKNMNLNAVWGTTPGSGWIAGDNSTLAELPTGATTWTVPSLKPPPSSQLNLYGAGGHDGSLWLAGEAGALWNGSGGQLTPSRSSSRINQLSGIQVGTNVSIWAAGNKGAVLRYNGAKWDAAPNIASLMTNENLNSVIAFSDSDVWVGGQNQTMWNYNGASWAQYMLAGLISGDAILGLWGISANNIWAVGSGGLIFHFNNGTWSSHPRSKTVTMNTITDIFGNRSDNIWAVGDNGDVIHFALDWAKSPALSAPAGTSLASVWVSPTGSVWVAGQNYLHRYASDGTEQALPPLPMAGNTTVLSVRGLSDSDVWAVASNGQILHFDGMTWSLKAPIGIVSNTRAVYPSHPDDVWVAGWNAMTLREGQGVILRYSPTP